MLFQFHARGSIREENDETTIKKSRRKITTYTVYEISLFSCCMWGEYSNCVYMYGISFSLTRSLSSSPVCIQWIVCIGCTFSWLWLAERLYQDMYVNLIDEIWGRHYHSQLFLQSCIEVSSVWVSMSCIYIQLYCSWWCCCCCCCCFLCYIFFLIRFRRLSYTRIQKHAPPSPTAYTPITLRVLLPSMYVYAWYDCVLNFSLQSNRTVLFLIPNKCRDALFHLMKTFTLCEYCTKMMNSYALNEGSQRTGSLSFKLSNFFFIGAKFQFWFILIQCVRLSLSLELLFCYICLFGIGVAVVVVLDSTVTWNVVFLNYWMFFDP